MPTVKGQVMLDTPTGSIPLKYTVEQIPDNSDAQVAATINRMCQYVNEDCQSYPIKHDAQVALSADPSNPLGCVHNFVRSRMRFTQDEKIAQPYGWLLPRDGKDNYFVEALKRPVDVSMEYAGTGEPVEGDCDDFSMYCAALLKAIGIDCCFATVGANSENPQVFSHVYCVAYCRGKRYAMDCSHGQYASWEVENKYGKFCEWPIYDRAGWSGVGVGLMLAGWYAWKHRGEIREMF
jgi:hypothetical protein